ncbi:MAG: hypothetical protein HUK22_00620, partial [Thermoguttaceae bacterium]|nr:hypothetical protein [Thermoguttaceae bacterium]
MMNHIFLMRRGRVFKPVKTEVFKDESNPKRDKIVIEIPDSLSAALYVPYLDDALGLCFVSTEALLPRRRARSLALELARGQLSRIIRNQAERKINFDKSSREKLARAGREFVRLTTQDPEGPEYETEAAEAFRTFWKLAKDCDDYFSDKTLKARAVGPKNWTTRLGVSADFGARFQNDWESSLLRDETGKETFDTYNPTLVWADIDKGSGNFDWSALDEILEWARYRCALTLGPFFRWDARTAPVRFRNRETTIDEFIRSYLTFMIAVADRVARSGVEVGRWIVATNAERYDAGISAETRLKLALEFSRIVHSKIPGAATCLGFERPFGEPDYSVIPAFEFAFRAAQEREFDGFYLELNIGDVSAGSPPFDPAEWGKFWDRWALVGGWNARLCVGASCPGGAMKIHRDRTISERPLSYEKEIWSTSATQRRRLWHLFNAIVSRPVVDEFIWTRLYDAPLKKDLAPDSDGDLTAQFPYSGLFDHLCK